jgi:hypothetical protein
VHEHMQLQIGSLAELSPTVYTFYLVGADWPLCSVYKHMRLQIRSPANLSPTFYTFYFVGADWPLCMNMCSSRFARLLNWVPHSGQLALPPLPPPGALELNYKKANSNNLIFLSWSFTGKSASLTAKIYTGTGTVNRPGTKPKH